MGLNWKVISADYREDARIHPWLTEDELVGRALKRLNALPICWMCADDPCSCDAAYESYKERQLRGAS